MSPGVDSDGTAPEVSVVIPTAGAGLLLGEQLTALAAQQGDVRFEVVVVANRSRLDTGELQQQWRDRLDLVVIRADDRAGAGYARNRGVEAARGAVLLFVDDDDVVAPDYVSVMSRALQDAPAVAARIDLTRLNEPWVREIRPTSQASGLADSGGIPIAGGGTLGVHRAVFDEVGPFAATFDGIAAEDTEWCLRLAAQGHELVFVPDAVVHCRARSGIRDVWEQGLRSGRGGEMVAPSTGGRLPWLRSLLGPIRLVVVGPGRGMRRRGVFLLGRRTGRAAARRDARHMRNTP